MTEGLRKMASLSTTPKDFKVVEDEKRIIDLLIESSTYTKAICKKMI